MYKRGLYILKHAGNVYEPRFKNIYSVVGRTTINYCSVASVSISTAFPLLAPKCRVFKSYSF